MLTLSPKAQQLILDFEGFSHPGQWPGKDSGITVGHGYDLGYCTKDQFLADWGERLPAPTVQRLLPVIGLTGIRAKNRAPLLSDLRIPKKAAAEVFTLRSVPRMVSDTLLAFPGVDKLPADAAGALVSLVYNRGGSMKDKPGSDNRREMRAIRDECAKAKPALKAMAGQIRSMKRLWQGQGVDGLLRRREAEAVLLEGAV
ncbi:MAG: hypothetical protein V4709_10935 [Pseudomonadota bacterium]